MSWNDQEAIDAERLEADFEQAELEAIGREHGNAHRRMRALRAAGKLDAAAAVCRHGGGYPLNSIAATNENDPRAGQEGHRCFDCGSVLDSDWRGDQNVIHACDWINPRLRA